MYFPYFRGRQYELLALRDLVDRKLVSSKIVPIIEPVKYSPTLKKTLDLFFAENHSLGLIFNPEVGEFSKKESFLDKFYQEGQVVTDNLFPTFISNKNAAECFRLFSEKEDDVNTISIVDNQSLEDYKNILEISEPKFSLLPDNREFRRLSQDGKVLFRDNFNKKPRNADYPEDEKFTEDNLYYAEEGCLGFGDYSIIGSDYIENGFAPYAVAIHIVYIKPDGSLWIKHFISDSNTDISDVAGKFSEAVGKLSDWYRDGNYRQQTYALDTLMQYHERGGYPGLPTIKKLSVMHHLELVNKFLTRSLPI